ncbi:MAG TPA: histidine kinase [Myxococcales bacterium]|nr:histidine kinase [Deltaproteobacteria bacterium]MBU50190.1 histidine kinase [Deltaproteobacteria bacterium]HAA56089.1 histidine kinase [Myxococcales bacterium]|tara:strand:+ start:507 stop:1166 length:660 start_codon:yes stop_codon:yes gene_type:complete
MTSLRFRYQTIEFSDGLDIHVRTLRDNMQFYDPDDIALELGISNSSWPLFGIVWETGRYLAELMLDFDIRGKRILEVGCGIGLASLVLNHRLADITSTDQHPDAEAFMQENVRINHGRDIPFVRTGWADEDSGMGTFDLLIASDVLYERSFAEPLSCFLDQHAKATCEIIVIDPGRGHHSELNKKMIVLGFEQSQEPTKHKLLPRGKVLRYWRVDTLEE